MSVAIACSAQPSTSNVGQGGASSAGYTANGGTAPGNGGSFTTSGGFQASAGLGGSFGTAGGGGKAEGGRSDNSPNGGSSAHAGSQSGGSSMGGNTAGAGSALGGAGAGSAITKTPCSAAALASAVTKVTLNGNNVKSANVNGLTFKGFGVLSANGTSELLLDYKAEHPERYAELLRILFGGARPIMTSVKVEMGNDRNNSTGPDPATMRTASEPANVKRSPGFQLAADAKKFNPNLRVSILRWNAPGWANTNDKVYTWFKSSILAAYRDYGLMVDYVNPGINERAPDLTWTKLYASRVKTDSVGFASETERSLYNAIQVVISDEAGLGSFGGAMLSDAKLRAAVAVSGYHYDTSDDSAGNFKKLAEQYDEEIWNSEAQATFSNTAFRPNNNSKEPSVAGTGIGGLNGPLEMGNTIIKGFVDSRRTHFVYQPALGSFYEGGQYSFKELLSARDPWSGWIHYDAALQVLRHFAWFAKTGWENANNSGGVWRVVVESSASGATGTNPVSGRNGSANYLTLAAPDKRDFSFVLMNDSESARTYQLQATNMASAAGAKLELWETRAAEASAAFNANYMKYLCDASPDGNGVYTVTVKPNSVLTATTLQNAASAEYGIPLPVEGARTVLDTDPSGVGHDTSDKVLYADDFDYSDKKVAVIAAGGALVGSENYVSARGGSQSAMPRYACDRNGAFEAFLPNGASDYVLRQQLDEPSMGLGGTWNAGDPLTAIGDNRWLDYKASVDVSFENQSTQSGKNYAAIGVRQQGGASSHTIAGTPYVLKFSFDGAWQLLVDGTAAFSGNVVSGAGGTTIAGFKAAYDAWHQLALQAVGKSVTAYIDGVLIATYTDAKLRLSGRVDLASGYYHTRFDNLKVETVDGAPAYYTELLDDLEVYDLSSPPLPKLVYGGAWSHANGKSMFNYQRSLSTSQGAGASLKYTFTGTGLDILGPNGSSAKLEVTVDGQPASQASSGASAELYQTFSLRGLSRGSHTVQIKVVSGTLVVDSVGVVL